MTERSTILPYGLWPSPISASSLANRLRLDDVQWAANGQTLVWAEGRSGGSALVMQSSGSARCDLTEERQPRGGVGYGGGIFTTGNDLVIFANRDGRLYRVGLRYDTPRDITPAFGNVASPVLSPDEAWVVFVYSDGNTDLLALVPADGSAWPSQLVKGADFYMQPTWHPSGDWLAWVEWNHPNMPWDATSLQLARVERDPQTNTPRLAAARQVGGGEDIPAMQPLFSPDGRWLSFIEESGEWHNLVLLNLETGQRRVLVEGNGFELATPAWVQGIRSYGWSPTSRGIFYTRYQGPFASLWVADLESGQSIPIDTTPYTWLTQLAVSPVQDEIAFLAAAPNLPIRVAVWNGTAAEGSRLRTMAFSGPETIHPSNLSVPREISWQAEDDTVVYALYYPPHLPGVAGEGLPPAILNVHGGPTSLANSRFDGEIAYFTSRGYAWVELNYRGSTGYGRAYRDALRGRWGEVDVEDAVGCAQALTEQELADPQRLVIRGGSAGGYTVLNALIRHPGLFKAGICLYGVSNLFTLDLDTHKFEKYYNVSLIGKLPAAARQYRAWSPVFNAERIADPLYIFQGEQDKVVPPAQSEEIVTALRQRRVPHKYKLYPGEGHGFRQSETIADYLKETERFLQQYVLFA